MIRNEGNHYLECSAHPELSLLLCDLGASVQQIYFRGQGMLYSLPKERFLQPNGEFFGQMVAPVAGRIKGGEAEGFVLDRNEFDNCLHSGGQVISWRPFEVETTEYPDRIEALFSRFDRLLQANYRAESRYILFKDRPAFALEMSLFAIDPCLSNITNHMYFSLGESDVESVVLQANTPYQMTYGPHLLPLRFTPIEPALDFTSGRKLDLPLDTAFALPDGKLSAFGSKVRLDMETSAPAVIVYRDAASEEITGKSKGFTLECVDHPEMSDLLLKASERQSIRTVYSFAPIGE